MKNTSLNVRELQEKDIPLVADYWFTADEGYLQGMGVDIARMPQREAFMDILRSQLALPYPEKKSYALIWEADGEAIGHCNLNPAFYGDHAFMHLHIWHKNLRNKGLGAELVRMSVPYFFTNLKLQRLYCEPYALNPSPNRIMEKCGFKFAEEYITTPGAITFEQPVKRWVMEKP